MVDSSFLTLAPNFLTASGGGHLGGIILVAILSLILVLGLLIGCFVITRNAGVVKEKVYKHSAIPLAIIGIVVVGFVARIIFAALITGYRADMSAMTGIAGIPVNEIYGGGIIFAPITAYIVAAFGGFGRLFSLESDSVGMQIMLKMPFLLADVGVFVLLYLIASKYLNKVISLVLASFVYLNPAIIWNSAISGQFNALTVLVLVAVMYALLRRNFLAMILLLGLAVLVDPFSLFFFPPVLVLSIYYYIRAIRKIRDNGTGFDIKAIVKDKEMRVVFSLPLYYIVALLGMYLVTLPLLNPIGFNFFTDFFHTFLVVPISGVTIFGYNALSIYNIFGRNTLPLGNFPNVAFALIFLALVFAVVAFVYLSKKNRANLTLAAICAAMMVAVFYMGFRENALIPILGLLILAYIVIQDKRIMHIFAVLSLLLIVNPALVFISAGYLNNLAANEIAGTTTIVGGPAFVINIIASAIAVAAVVYFIYLILDIAMQNNRKAIRTFDTKVGLPDAIANWIK